MLTWRRNIPIENQFDLSRTCDVLDEPEFLPKKITLDTDLSRYVLWYLYLSSPKHKMNDFLIPRGYKPCEVCDTFGCVNCDDKGYVEWDETTYVERHL